MNEDQFKKLKAEVDKAKAESDRAQGALDQLKQRLDEEFGCKDFKEAKKLLSELREKKEATEEAFTKAMEAYEKKWKGD